VSPDFIEQFGQALEQLRSVFLTEKGQPFVLAGSGTIALLPLEPSAELLPTPTT
jgi:alanine-glyoxylate transaminase/serine-glyoxylate transaminase/serine-pyruvate transaminase